MDQGNFLDNKYSQWYFAIVERARTRKTNDYVEEHHIVPRSFGGSNSKTNLVKLTAREHFVCHLLLIKMTSGKNRWRMICAAHHMSVCDRKELYKLTSITYERLKRQRSQSMMGELNPMYGKRFTWTQESKNKLSHALKTSEAFKACHNDTWKQHVSEAQSRGVVLINSITREKVGEWANCSRIADHFGCTRANVKAAIRNKTCIGKKLKSLNNTAHYVVWSDDFTSVDT